MTAVTVEYFAQLREQAGIPREAVDSAASSMTELYAERRLAHGFRLEAAQLRVAVNARFCDWSQALVAGDVVVFVPPVAGG